MKRWRFIKKSLKKINIKHKKNLKRYLSINAKYLILHEMFSVHIASHKGKCPKSGTLNSKETKDY